MDFHIGAKIKKVTVSRGLSTEQLAKMVSMTRQNLDKVYRKKIIDTDLLFRLSKALNFDFFALFTYKLNGKSDNLKERAEWEWQEGVKSMALGPNENPEVDEYDIWLVDNAPNADNLIREKEAELERIQKDVATMEKLLESKEEILDLLRNENKRLKELSVK